MKKRVTIYDIAKHAGVSTATVSRVMNSPNLVAEATLKKVKKSMKELSYIPSMVAAGMPRKKTNYIGVIIPDITNSFFSQLVRSIQDECESLNYSVIVVNSDDKREKEMAYIRFLYSRRVDGVIITAAGYKEKGYTKKELELMNEMKLVLIDREIKGLSAPIIKVKNLQGAYNACKYLIDNGHRKILYISGIKGTKTNEERKKGYLKALQEAGIDWRKELNGEFRLDISYRNTLNYWRTAKETPTAIFAANDTMAIGAIRALEEMGVQIPEEVSIVGFDNIPFSDCVSPPLTTVSQPTKEIGRRAVSLLMNRINGKEAEPQTELDTMLIRRKSVKNIV